MTNSKRQADARWITTQFVLFFFIDIWQKLFFFVNVWRCFGLQETEASSADERPNLHSLPDESREPAVGDVVAVEGGAPVNQSYTMSESAYNEDDEASCGATAAEPAAAAKPVALAAAEPASAAAAEPAAAAQAAAGPKRCRLDLWAMNCN